MSEVHDLGAATARAAQSARNTRNSYDDETPEEVDDYHSDTQFGADERGDEAYDSRAADDGEIADENDAQGSPYAARRSPPGEEEEHQRPPRSYRGLIQLIVALIILGGLAATISWQWPRISGLYNSLTQIGAKQPSQPQHEAAGQPKFPGRVPQEQSGAPAAGAGTPGAQAVPAVAQRVVLYEEDFEQSARQTLCRLGDLAHRDSFARPGTRAGTGGARRRHHSGTQDNHDLVAAPQYRPSVAREPHD